ncbi:MAG: DUF4007 family protein [Ardenticatenaceae bacterium]
MAKTVGFYGNFNLNLQRLSRALACIQESPTLNQKTLANCMGVNQPVAAGFSHWLRHTGLVSRSEVALASQGSRSYELTSVGALIAEHDPALADLGTQWLLHYYLATEQEERSEAWLVLFNQFLSPGMTFSSAEYQAYFANVMGDGVSNRSAVKKDPISALFTYTNRKSLTDLALLTKQKKVYVVGKPHYPDSLVIGFMLFDWWKRQYDYSNTLRFSQLCEEEESLGRLCVATPSQVRRFVVQLTGLGYLTFSETQHEPVNRLYEDEPYLLLKRYYER